VPVAAGHIDVGSIKIIEGFRNGAAKHLEFL
jgi:hypothetical protein